MQRLVAVTTYNLHQTLFAKLAEVIFGFRDSIGVAHQNVARAHLESVLLVAHPVHQAHDGAPLVQSTDDIIATQNQGRELSGV